MALSNWDALAVDHAGDPLDEPSFTTASGACFLIYKNWVYVRSELMWSEAARFSYPTIAQVHEGELVIGGARLSAFRGPRDGVYVIVTETAIGPDGGSRHRAMVGIGCEGFEGEAWVGITEREVEHLRGLLARHGEGWLCSVDLSRAARHNQGDAFFARHYGIPTPDSAPGESDGPLLNDAVRGLRARWTGEPHEPGA